MQQSEAISVFENILVEIENTTKDIFLLLDGNTDIDLDGSILIEDLYILRGKQIESLAQWEKDFSDASVVIKASDKYKNRVNDILETEKQLQDILKTKVSALRTSLKSIHQNKNVLAYKKQQ